MQLGATHMEGGRCEFLVWAPACREVSLHQVSPRERVLPMEPQGNGYWRIIGEEVPPGSRYFYHLDGERDRPDPVSNYQPQGVHGPSQVIDHRHFAWSDHGWRGCALADLVIYELHVGTFTPAGTFDAVIERLPGLRDLGITAIELMPVAQFPGERNWGYDGVQPFAVQHSYGGPEGLKRLVDACHQLGLAVVLDVVYNHLGPEGNYLWDFGPYFTDHYRTPWGEAINFDGPHSDEVRRYFLQNALHWFKNYHIDALRLDAVHAIYDFSAKTFLQEMAEQTREFSLGNQRSCLLIAESDLNDPRIIRPAELGGYGLDAQWSDDFHHALHALITGEDLGYYGDFGSTGDLVKSYREGFVYSWRYSAFRKCRHGASAADRPAQQFVVCSQNHDQVGNRMRGERLIAQAGFEAAKLAAAAVILSPFIPLLFMGEEYGEDNPFPYFVSFEDEDLIAGVRRGRKEEFEDFHSQGEPPDPQSPETFAAARLDWSKRDKPGYRAMAAFYRELLRLRRENPVLTRRDKEHLEGWGLEDEKLLWLRRWSGKDELWLLANFNNKEISCSFPGRGSAYRKLLDSADRQWQGPGTRLPDNIEGRCKLNLAPQSLAVYQMTD
ncbi:maltooligosyl trehalose hydrolase [Geoalkalibacter ferrihydriticus]|uniref:Malto-oligosyltrehalose trehalohydrolase n=2 Tax=Geoalkalibacter ferrihydriticus TaxID=392333 RepID=A0A0C2HLS5_9BACT|nr:malto-oligosyltrehalose trehalohydrolase [Geoalkalibacter ferrihydriticus]KIH78066.1 malto-oligosyltrehalose trehalohydrolase [Geoalkalibacter ferrihydriticus DSM 17813]SDM30913.1 maltooligosyl trehalose hydrolase [Geoalkalibacter ferrihydriticus]